MLRTRSILEGAVLLLLISLCLWWITPGIGEGLKLAHETTVKHSASALRDSVRFLQMRAQARSDSRWLAPLASEAQTGRLRREDCAALWSQLLGNAAPTVSLHHEAHFRVTLQHHAQHGLGCRFGYALAGNMFIDYFPVKVNFIIDDRYD